jgi:hypothetical protein
MHRGISITVFSLVSPSSVVIVVVVLIGSNSLSFYCSFV